jgi:hypothetical protein
VGGAGCPECVCGDLWGVEKTTIEIIQQVAEFMNVQLTSAQLESIVEKSSFDWMKAHEPRFRPLVLPGRGSKDGPRMMRSGQSGKSAELLSAEQQAAVDQYFSARLQQLNSDFPYDGMFSAITKGR